MTDQALTTTLADDERSRALLAAVGFDKLSPAQRELALAIANRYGLDPMLKHLVMIEGRPYITRDGLLHVAHRSGELDGIEVTPPVLADGFWTASASVYRKDMSRPFTYAGRYPEAGQNKKFAPEMAVKVAEVMALRRAFDVAAPTAEERWDVDVPETTETTPPVSLSERIADRAAAIPETVVNDAEPVPVPETPEAPVGTTETAATPDPAPEPDPAPAAPEPDAPGLSLQAFRGYVAEDGFDNGFVRATAKRMFPDAARFSDLDEQQLYVLYRELKDTTATVDEALAATAAPDEPVKTGEIVLCGEQSPFSVAVCTMDAGHKGVHRAGVSESW